MKKVYRIVKGSLCGEAVQNETEKAENRLGNRQFQTKQAGMGRKRQPRSLSRFLNFLKI